MPIIGQIEKGQDLGYLSSGRNLYIWQACPDCGKERWVMLSVAKRRLNQICCRRCGARRRAPLMDMKGAYNPQWKGGRRKLNSGYIELWISPDSPFIEMAHRRKNNSFSILEHRLVMAKYLNRCLDSSELVHHKNGIRGDNQIENLFVVYKENHEHRTLEKELQKEIRLLKWQVKVLTERMNKAGIPYPLRQRSNG